MASPTYAEIIADFKRCIYPLHLLRLVNELNSSPVSLATQFDNIQQGVEGDYSVDLLNAVETLRRSCASSVSREIVRSIILPHLLHLAKLAKWPDTDLDGLMSRWYDYCVTNSYSVKGRNITRGPISVGGSNVGSGTISRLLVDENAYNIEACNVEKKVFTCIGDTSSSSSKGEEVFEIIGEARSKDGLDTLGSGISGQSRAISGRDSAQYIDNPSFDTYEGTDTVPTAITGWTVDTIANVDVDVAGNYYRQFPETTTALSYSLKFTGNAVVSRPLGTRKVNPNVPYYVQVAYNRATFSGDGTLTLRFGNNSVAVVLSAQTGWNILRLALDKNLWFKYFDKQDLALSVELSGRSTGQVLVDDVIFSPMLPVDGTYFAIVGGVTPFLKLDTFSFTDTLAGADSIIQYWLARATGRYLPFKTDTTETIADPP